MRSTIGMGFGRTMILRHEIYIAVDESIYYVSLRVSGFGWLILLYLFRFKSDLIAHA